MRVKMAAGRPCTRPRRMAIWSPHALWSMPERIHRSGPITTSSPWIWHSPQDVRRWSSSWKRSERSCNVDISELHASALAALERASTLEELEAVRVEALGRKGKLAEV